MAEGDPRKRGVKKLRELQAKVPKPSSGLPECPRHLRGRARSVWNFWAEELAVMKVDKRPDGPMLEGACCAYERAVKADLILRKDGLICEERAIVDDEVIVLKIKKHPAVDISHRAWMQVKAFCTEFGLSPVSRVRLVAKDNEVDPDEAALMDALRKPRATTTAPVLSSTSSIH